MANKPSQSEIDAVAYFVEAVRELRVSPFYMEEYRSLGISMREGESTENVTGRFSDPNVLRAVLVPFRRIWLQNEPCHHYKVVNVLKRYMPYHRGFLDSFRFTDQRSVARQMPWYKELDLSPTDAINIWLNTKFHHVGTSSRTGRFTREDFERWNVEIGPVLFEYYFLMAVHEAGISFFNIQQFAENFLRDCGMAGLSPSFKLDPHPAESNIQRQTPGVSLSEDSPEKRIWRLRHRNH